MARFDFDLEISVEEGSMCTYEVVATISDPIIGTHQLPVTAKYSYAAKMVLLDNRKLMELIPDPSLRRAFIEELKKYIKSLQK